MNLSYSSGRVVNGKGRTVFGVMAYGSDRYGWQSECVGKSCSGRRIPRLEPSLIWLMHHRLDRYIPPEEFEEYQNMGREMGFISVISGSLVRSSFHAAETYLFVDNIIETKFKYFRS